MVVRIRLARFGRKRAPLYNIVISQARTARNSKPIEVLGTYDPIPKAPLTGRGMPYKDIKLDSSRTKYWLGVGAQPSDPVWRLLAMAGLIEPKHIVGVTESTFNTEQVTEQAPKKKHSIQRKPLRKKRPVSRRTKRPSKLLGTKLVLDKTAVRAKPVPFTETPEQRLVIRRV